MFADQMRSLFAYNYWAWRHIFASMQQLDVAAYHEKRPFFTPTSLHEMLVHCLAAEHIWLNRCLGNRPTTLLSAEAFADLTAVQRRWAVVEDDWDNFLRGVPDKMFVRPIDYQNTHGKALRLTLGDLLQHVMNHATEHRSQMTPLLYQLDVPTPPLDYMRYCLEQQG